jgi:hypothetical protein
LAVGLAAGLVPRVKRIGGSERYAAPASASTTNTRVP